MDYVSPIEGYEIAFFPIEGGMGARSAPINKRRSDKYQLIGPSIFYDRTHVHDRTHFTKIPTTQRFPGNPREKVGV
jgi:hypothetical protein